jgi:drug/metabolite transporter (DMT)-like permease
MAARPSSVLVNLFAVSLLWGSSFLFVKLTNGEISPFALAACRGLIGTAALAAYFVWRGMDLRPRREEVVHWIVLGMSNGWLPNILLAYAMTQIGSGLGAMIQASGPLMIAALAPLFFQEERLTPRRALGVLVGFAGMAVLIGPNAFGGGSLMGALARVAIAASYSAGNLYVRAIPKLDPVRLAFGQQLFSGAPALALALAVGGASAFAPALDHAAALIALGVLATAAPMALFMRLIQEAGPVRASMVGYLQPVIATVLGVAFLAETIGPRELAGGVIVLAGVALVTWQRRVLP